MKKIPLSQGKFALVDDEDHKWLSQHKWCAVKDGNTFYAARGCREEKGWTTLVMHRAIMMSSKGQLTDHRNGNGLDNQKANLRICTRSQNGQNQRPRKDTSSRYKGVTWRKKARKWQVYITDKYLGCYANEIEAAAAYNERATELFGEFAYLNIIQQP